MTQSSSDIPRSAGDVLREDPQGFVQACSAELVRILCAADAPLAHDLLRVLRQITLLKMWLDGREGLLEEVFASAGARMPPSAGGPGEFRSLFAAGLSLAVSVHEALHEEENAARVAGLEKRLRAMPPEPSDLDELARASARRLSAAVQEEGEAAVPLALLFDAVLGLGIWLHERPERIDELERWLKDTFPDADLAAELALDMQITRRSLSRMLEGPAQEAGCDGSSDPNAAVK